ncbi:MAG: diacylglycerol kinase family protein [Candidatus Saccharibacteria bacterium]|nr:diacylglycerol kinase family protein [Candidatus Saccharibacteria bacterium]
MKRTLIVYNPRSSRYADVRTEVIDKVSKLKGHLIGKYEVTPTNLDDNIAKLAKLLKDDDLIISAGGDATGIIASNAILKSSKDVTLAALPYGNFNDLARTLGTKTLDDIMKSDSRITNYYPLEIFVDGKFFRYATCYVTIGMTAEAVQIYDSPKMRAKLKSGFGRKISSYTNLAGWYFKHRHKHIFIPEFKLNGVLQPAKTTDYAAVNGRSMARVMKGGEDYRDPTHFRHETDRLANFFRLAKLMLRSIFSRIPGTPTEGDILEFAHPANVTLQAEGESIKLEGINKIEIRKSKKCLKTIEN